MPDSVTQILSSGPPGTKFNIAVLGDGFAQADQTEYNNLVQALLLDGVFGHDYFYEDRQAYNIYRVNLISAQSGVSTKQYDEHGTPDDASDDTVVSVNIRNTSLGYIYSGSWAHCWLEGGANTSANVNAALSAWVPDYNLVVVILNTTGFGGCGGGGFQIVTKGVDWTVLAHEFGHGAGGLADEYCTSRSYSGGEPGAKNVTADTNRATLKPKLHRPVDASTHGNGIVRRIHRGRQAGRLERHPRCRTVRGRRHQWHRHVPAGHQLPHERQLSRVLSHLLYRNEEQSRRQGGADVLEGIYGRLQRRWQRRRPDSHQ